MKNVGGDKMYLPDFESEKLLYLMDDHPIKKYETVISQNPSDEEKALGDMFAKDISDNFISDFKKEGDTMVHVSTYTIINDVIYMTYYASPEAEEETPEKQRARFVFCNINTPDQKTYFDLQCAGEMLGNKKVDCVYDTILMQKDDDTLFLMWTAKLSGDYYRLYKTYSISKNELTETKVNRLKVGNTVVDWNIPNMKNAFAENNIPCKKMGVDIGVMQKITTRFENGETYYYTGAYCWDFNCIIKSKDMITWEYVAQPDFANQSLWENAVYTVDDKVYYFVRQHHDWGVKTGFLTYYDLVSKKWATPVLVDDSQSRSDFIMHKGELYLFHAPIDREHIGVIKIDRNKLENSKRVFVAKMSESCFYPFVQWGNGQLYFSYTMDRKAIKLSKFDADKYLK